MATRCDDDRVGRGERIPQQSGIHVSRKRDHVVAEPGRIRIVGAVVDHDDAKSRGSGRARNRGTDMTGTEYEHAWRLSQPLLHETPVASQRGR